MVSAFVKSNDFMGHGEASFRVDELIEFSRALDHLGQNRQGAPEVAGGHSENGNLATVLLSLRAYVVDRLGHLALRVEAAAPFEPGDPSAGEERVVAILVTEPSALSELAKRLARAARGGVGAIELA